MPLLVAAGLPFSDQAGPMAILFVLLLHSTARWRWLGLVNSYVRPGLCIPPDAVQKGCRFLSTGWSRCLGWRWR